VDDVRWRQISLVPAFVWHMGKINPHLHSELHPHMHLDPLLPIVLGAKGRGRRERQNEREFNTNSTSQRTLKIFLKERLKTVVQAKCRR
jgi:hypothetical protein